MSSISRNRALVDGNKRLAWMAAVAFCDLNDHDLHPPTTDAAYDLVIAASAGTADVDALAADLAAWIHPF